MKPESRAPIMKSWTLNEQNAIRQDVIRWLFTQESVAGTTAFTRSFLRTEYSYEGHTVPLIDRQNGIWNPRNFNSTLSLTKTLKSPYVDTVGDDDLWYSYERLQGRLSDAGRNTKLRQAAQLAHPLVYFDEVRTGYYIAMYPIYALQDASHPGYVKLQITPGQIQSNAATTPLLGEARYAAGLTKFRLHQKAFRSRVLKAYNYRCAICGLELPSLLDAAHITPDSEMNSPTSTDNGISLCKIHHASFDKNVLAFDANYRVRIRPDILNVRGESMMKHVLQEFEGKHLRLPHSIVDWPDGRALSRRYSTFLELWS